MGKYQDQDLALQLDVLTKEGCEKIFRKKLPVRNNGTGRN